jgi:hypothetical protein
LGIIPHIQADFCAGRRVLGLKSDKWFCLYPTLDDGKTAWYLIETGIIGGFYGVWHRVVRWGREFYKD